MTNSELSNQFDILWNNIMSNQAPGLDEYEKSVFLTEAQRQIVLSYYGGKPNSVLSFEMTEEVRRYLGYLVKTVELTAESNPQEILLNSNSKVFILPNKLWFITYESAILSSDSDNCIDGREVLVEPVTQDTYYKVSNNPFRGANDRRALRLDIGDNKVELVSKYNIDKYLVRYIEKLDPIILVDLDGGLSIEGKTEATECKLNDALHYFILRQAVNLAKDAWTESIGKNQQ